MASKINDYIRGFFKIFERYDYDSITVSYENNDCFKHFFEVKQCEDSILGVYYLVPAFIFKDLSRLRNTNIPIQTCKSMLHNLTETTLLSEIGRKHVYGNRYYHLQKLQTKAGETYYGTNGIILDSNFNILIMVVLKVINMNILDVICYINPSIFVNEKRTVEKAIIKKMLPFMCTNEVSVNNNHKGYITAIFKDVTKDYIHIPVEPGEEFCDDYVNNRLISWEDEIIHHLEEHFNE